MEIEIKVVIPSKGRANTITTHKHIANAIVCVAQSELKEYKKFHPDIEFSTHPDNVIGLGPKREWIRKKFGNVMMIDDDILGMNRLTAKKGERSRLDPETAYWIIQQCGNLAKLAGCYLFGFNTYVTPISYIGTQPFDSRGFVNGAAMGLLKGSDKIKFHPDIKVNHDIYITGLNAFFYRKAFIDNRYCITQDGIGNKVGGAASARTREAELNDLNILKKCFGTAIKESSPKDTSVKHEFYKKLVIPY